ncbi:hypothetical protein SBDP1_720003 [Syntrophobacter sp. SbD1]|nr:hypothetical protein SBDP1_720003 [Syntrophobacter sp. SbD1]
METYIVRIYRREPGTCSKLAGMVEEPGCPERKSFADIDQLLGIISEGSFTGGKHKCKATLERRKGDSK